MPFPRTHNLITFIGDAYSQQEIWQTSLRLDSSDRVDLAQLEAIAEAYADFHAASTSGISIQARFLAAKGALIGPDGRYPNDVDAIEFVRPTPLPGGGPGLGVPQLSTVVTLNTTRTRGPGSVGRMFPPSTAFTPQPDGRMTAATALGIAENASQMIADINSVGAGPVTVFGQTGAGTAYVVTSTRVGRVIDTQRRRRNALAEEYSEAPVVP